MNTFSACLLGLIQGLTEFLPVSSSGHLAIAQHFLPGFEQPGLLFDVLLHAATTLAVVIYFRTDIWKLLNCYFRPKDQTHHDRHILHMLILGSIPTAIIGFSGKDFFAGLFDNLLLIGFMLLVTATLLTLAEKIRKDGRSLEQINNTDAFLVGIVQGLAIIPGISRSGSTISFLLLRGVDGEAAARFSFLLALPAIGGALLLSLKDLQHVATAELPAYGLGAVIAFISGLFAIRCLMDVVRRKRLIGFAIYCLLVGGSIIGYSLLSQ
ncbi:MAG: undecaprenyl-diphosphatase UppP [Deltaproteobacteria bacterium]|nr:undecaprenyl-diphosphatase UppP [Deltaproteobacteria bacterium]MCW8892536.1 undecaprenyl-diphosphatase UppP [Deltaproteobacteria bacterium]MCW9050253.1 undecaprenyl-diphosphatase UppP [Deltaproteobacteria bacterium]